MPPTVKVPQAHITRLVSQACKTMVRKIVHLRIVGQCVYCTCIMNGSGHLLKGFEIPLC